MEETNEQKNYIIKMQSPEDWKWVGTTSTSLNCSASDIDKYIDIWKKIEKQGMDVLDIHVFTRGVKDGYDMVNIQFLKRPSEDNSSR